CLRRLLGGRAELGIGQQPYRGRGLLLDLGLAFGGAAEPPVREPARVLHELDELRLGNAADRVRFAPLLRSPEQGRLDLVQRRFDDGREGLELRRRLAARAAGHHHLSRREVAWPELEPQRHALRLPLEVLRPGLYGVAARADRKSTRLNSSHVSISYAV